ncbi:MAG: ATP-binding protein, partial [Planctomycetes bacterium]|nr:ATP-binding protein [Planctomycetota bacterium]
MQILTFLKTPPRNTEQKILRLMLFAVLPLMTILTVYSVINITEIKTEVAKKAIYDQSGNANKRITLFFEPIFRDIRYLQARGNTKERLNPKNPEDIRDFLGRFSSFYLQNVNQVLFWDGETTTVYTLNENGCTGPEKITQEQCSQLLDKTLKKADPNKIDWHPGDLNSESHKSTILAATVFQNPKSNKSYAVALNIDATDFFAGLKKYMEARLFLMSNLPERLPQQFLLTDDGKPDIEETNDPLILAVFTQWKSGKTNNDQAFRFIFDAQPWWVSIRSLQIKNKHLYSGLIVPESEIIAAMRQGRPSLKWFPPISFVLILIATIFLWRRYQYDITQTALPPALNGMDNAQLLEVIAAGENDGLEFKSTLRWNLRSNKPDKAMEIACLKTMAAFLNSEGGTLLVGVEDDGHILGIGADKFPNEDKFLLH